MKADRITWRKAATHLDTYGLIEMLTVHSQSEGTFAVSVYERLGTAEDRLYCRADPQTPAETCWLSGELGPLLPPDARLGEPHDADVVRVLADGERRIKEHRKTTESEGDSDLIAAAIEYNCACPAS